MKTNFAYLVLAAGVLGLGQVVATATGQPLFSGLPGWDSFGLVENLLTGLIAAVCLVPALASLGRRHRSSERPVAQARRQSVRSPVRSAAAQFH